MKNNKSACRTGAYVVVALTALASRPALSAGFQLFEQTVSGLGTAYAGQAAAAEDASTIFFNPAGLTKIKGLQVVTAVHVVRPRSEFHDGGSCSPYLGTGAGTTSCPFGANGNLGHVAGSDPGTAEKTGYVPNLYISHELLADKLWVGLGVNAPFGLATRRDGPWVGRFSATTSQTEAININPTVAWQIGDRLAVGGGLNLQHLSAKLANAVSYRALALASGNSGLIAGVPAGAEGIVTMKGDDWGWGWNAGLRAKLTDDWLVAASYRSSIGYRLKGTVRFSDRPAALGSVALVADGDVESDVRLPDTLSLAAAFDASPGWQWRADWTHTGWKSVQDLNILRTSGALAGQLLSTSALRLKDSWRAGVGVVWTCNETWKLRSGLAFETTPVQDAYRTPRLPDSDHMEFGVGAQWAHDNLALDVGLMFVRYKDAPSSLPNQDSATAAPHGSLVGHYSADARILGIQARWSH